MKRAIVGALLAALLGCKSDSSSVAPPAPAPTEVEETASLPLDPLHIDGSFFKDPFGRVVILHGLNYSHRSKSGPDASWQREEHFARMKEWGFNVVRYLVIWEDLEPQPGAYNTAYLDQIEQAVQWAEKNGIYVIIDFHQDLFARIFGGDGAPPWACVDNLVTPNELRTPWWSNYITEEVKESFDAFFSDPVLRDRYASAWERVVNRVRTYTNVVGYDMMNEPFPGGMYWFPFTFEMFTLTDFYNELAARIQSADPLRPVFVEPIALFGNNGVPTLVGRPSENCVYAPHYYNPFLAARIGYPVLTEAINPDTAFMLHKWVGLRWNTPSFLGEFGVDLDVPGAMQGLMSQLDAADRNLLAGWAYWDYNPDQATNNTIEVDEESVVAPDGTERESLNVLVRPYPRAIAGRPTQILFDVGRRQFDLSWNGDAGFTTVHIPRRHYPNGIYATVSGAVWDYDPATELLTVTAFAPGSYTLTVTPQ